MSFDFCLNIREVGSETGIKNMNVEIYPTLYQRFKLRLQVVVVKCHRDIFCYTVGDLFKGKDRLNTTAYLDIVARHVSQFMTTVHPPCGGYFQQDNALCHKSQIVENMFMENSNVFSVLK